MGVRGRAASGGGPIDSEPPRFSSPCSASGFASGFVSADRPGRRCTGRTGEGFGDFAAIFSTVFLGPIRRPFFQRNCSGNVRRGMFAGKFLPAVSPNLMFSCDKGMKNIKNPNLKPYVFSAEATDLLEAPPGNLDSSSLASSSPWLDFWRKISVLAEDLGAEELGAEAK